MSAGFAPNTAIWTSVSPVSAVPWTAGIWARRAGTGTRATFALASGGTTNHYWHIRYSSPNWEFRCRAGSAGAVSAAATAGTTGNWEFVVVRAISATNRHIAVLDWGTGVITHGSSTTSKSVTTTDSLFLECAFAALVKTEYFDGEIAEWWIADADIQPDGGQLNDNLMHALARQGPFGIPWVASRVAVYRSLRTGDGNKASPHVGRADEDYYRSGVPLTWTRTGTPSLKAHPPLPARYADPYDARRVAVI